MRKKLWIWKQVYFADITEQHDDNSDCTLCILSKDINVKYDLAVSP